MTDPVDPWQAALDRAAIVVALLVILNAPFPEGDWSPWWRWGRLLAILLLGFAEGRRVRALLERRRERNR